MTDQISSTFAALADPTRRAILARLAAGECSVTELAAPFEMSMPAVSKHLRVLERAGLVAHRAARRRRPAGGRRADRAPGRGATAAVPHRGCAVEGGRGLDRGLPPDLGGASRPDG